MYYDKFAELLDSKTDLNHQTATVYVVVDGNRFELATDVYVDSDGDLIIETQR